MASMPHARWVEGLRGAESMPTRPVLPGDVLKLRLPRLPPERSLRSPAGQDGEHRARKHVLAVRLYCELVKAQQPAPRRRRQGHLYMVETERSQ